MINVIPKNYFSQIQEFQLELNDNKNVIGTGSFGVVKMALHKGTNKIYAIKIINLKKIESESQIKIIQREIKLHSSLDHPHIIKLWDTLIKDSVVYMIMEYCDKGNLFYYQNSKVKFTEPQTFQYFYQCAKAIEYIHKQNIIHRDIKPQNLLLDQSFNLKICDFGWSAEDIHLKRNTFCGTYEYMAPQMILKKPYNYKIDIWGLGIFLYQLLHGYAPFRGNTLQVISKEIQKGQYELNANLSQQVKGLIKLILQFNPQNRPSFEVIFAHEWIKKMKCQINSFLKKQQLASNSLITQKISKIIPSVDQKPYKKKTHKKAESASYIPTSQPKDKKSIQINFSINNYQLIGLKDKLKKKGDIAKRCKTMTQQSMKRLMTTETLNPLHHNNNYLSPPPQYIQPKQKKQLKKHMYFNLKSPKHNNGNLNKVQQRVNTQASQKKILRKKRSIEETLNKLSKQCLKKQIKKGL